MTQSNYRCTRLVFDERDSLISCIYVTNYLFIRWFWFMWRIISTCETPDGLGLVSQGPLRLGSSTDPSER